MPTYKVISAYLAGNAFQDALNYWHGQGYLVTALMLNSTGTKGVAILVSVPTVGTPSPLYYKVVSGYVSQTSTPAVEPLLNQAIAEGWSMTHFAVNSTATKVVVVMCGANRAG